MTILNPISDDCPFHTCDGSGYIQVMNEEEYADQIADRKRRQEAGLGRAIYPPYEYMRECECLPQIKLKKRGGIALIPEDFRGLTIKSFDIGMYTPGENQEIGKTAKAAAVQYVRGFDRVKEDFEGKGLYLWSRTKGSGKTRLAASLGNALIQTHIEKGKYLNVKFAVVIDMIEEIKSTFDKDSELTKSKIMNDLENCDVLILDEIGMESDTPFVSQTIYKLLNYRMNRKLPTIFTSNIPIEELDDRYRMESGRSTDGGRISSRIKKMAIPISLPEEKVRDDIAEQQNLDFGKFLLGD